MGNFSFGFISSFGVIMMSVFFSCRYLYLQSLICLLFFQIMIYLIYNHSLGKIQKFQLHCYEKSFERKTLGVEVGCSVISFVYFCLYLEGLPIEADKGIDF